MRIDYVEMYKICLNQQSKNHVCTNVIYKYWDVIYLSMINIFYFDGWMWSLLRIKFFIFIFLSGYDFFWKRWEYQTTWSASWEICMQVRKQQLELDMEQQTDSK